MSEYVFGKLTALNSLEADKAKSIYIQREFSDLKIMDQVQKRHIRINYVTGAELNKLAKGGNHQGIVVEVDEYEYSTLNEIILSAKDKSQPLILILDGVNDPHNLGAIIRSCDAFSVDGIIIKNRNQVPVTMTVSKVSTGAVNYVKIAQVSNLNNAIQTLKENGYWIYSADGTGKDDYSKLSFDGKVCLVLGSEGEGISNLVLKNSDFIMKIPMTGHVNSLNVSVAAGILLSRIRN